MKEALSLIYGEQVIDDLEFCKRHNNAIKRYAHRIMTLQGSLEELEAAALDPTTIAGWTHLFEAHPEDVSIIREFLSRLLVRYAQTRRLRQKENKKRSKIAERRR